MLSKVRRFFIELLGGTAPEDAKQMADAIDALKVMHSIVEGRTVNGVGHAAVTVLGSDVILQNFVLGRGQRIVVHPFAKRVSIRDYTVMGDGSADAVRDYRMPTDGGALKITKSQYW